MEKKNPTVVIINPATGESKVLTRLSYDEVWEVLEEMEDNRAAADSALTGEAARTEASYKAGQRELEELKAALEPFPMVRETMELTVGINRLTALAMAEATATSEKFPERFEGQPFTIAKQVKALNSMVEDPFKISVAFALLNESVIRIRKTKPDEFEDIPLNSAEKLAATL